MKIDLRNKDLTVSVRPDLGGRIDQITDMRTGKEWLWHPQGYDEHTTRSLDLGASFDDNWSGGWDEMFPNDAAGSFRGRKLVDHGELWSQAWQVVERGANGVKMALACVTAPVTVEKSIFIDGAIDETSDGAVGMSGARVSVDYLLKNRSSETLPFLLKMHPALKVEEGDRIFLPGCEVEAVELAFSQIIGRSGKTRFPFALGRSGDRVQLDQIPSFSSKLREFFYCSDLEEGECGIKNVRTGSHLRFTFDRNQFPFVWVFQSFGGFNGHYVVMVEPCTTKPYDLEDACRLGTAALLEPHEARRFHMEAIVSWPKVAGA